MKNTVIIFLATFFVAINSFNAQSKKELKNQEDLKKYEAMKSLVENGELSFEANTAFTQSGRRIDLVTNPNNLTLDGETSTGDLPYYGIIHSASFSEDYGINFKNENTEYSIKYNDKKQKIIIKFRAQNNTESFNLTLTISGDGYASLNINSSHRNLINYNGHVKTLESKKE